MKQAHYVLAAALIVSSICFQNCSGAFQANDRGESASRSIENQPSRESSQDGSGDARVPTPTPILAPQNNQQLISNAQFSSGFRARVACGASTRSCGPDYTVANPYTSAAAASPWILGQTGSLNSLLKTGVAEGDHYIFRDDSALGEEKKSLVIYSDGRIEMAINGFNEQKGAYVTWSEERKWPHFLFEQIIAAPGGGAETSKSLAEMKGLVFDLDVQAISNDNKHLQGYDPSKHAAQFLIYFTVQNLRGSHQTNPNYGDDYLWLGIPVFDDRYPMTAGSTITDNGPNNTGRPIVTIPYSAFSNISTHSGQLIHLHADLLDYARDSVAKSCGIGKPLASCDFSDYKIGTMNIGYEVTGANRVALRFGGISLRAIYQ